MAEHDTSMMSISRGEYAELKRTIESLKFQKQQMANELRDIMASHDADVHQASLLIAENRKLMTELEASRNSAPPSPNRSFESNAASRALAVQEQELAVLRAANERLEQAFARERTHDQSHAELLAEIDELESARRQHLMRISRDNATIAELQAQVFDLKSAAIEADKKHQSVLESMQKHVRELETQLERLRDETAVLRETGALGSPATSTEAGARETALLRAKLRTSEANAGALSERLAQLEIEAESVRSAYTQFVAAARSKASESDARAADAVASMQAAVRRADALQAQLDAAESRSASLNGSLDHARGRMASLESAPTPRSAAAQASREDAASSIQSALAQAVADRDALAVQLSRMQQDVDELRSKHSSYASETATLRRELNEARDRSRSLAQSERSLTAAENERDAQLLAALAEIDALRGSLAALDETQQSVARARHASDAALRAQLKETGALRTSLEARLELAVQETNRLRDSQREFVREALLLKDARDEAHAAVQTARGQLEGAEKGAAALRLALLDAQSHLASLTNTVAGYEAQIEELTRRLRAFEARSAEQVDSLRVQATQLDEKAAALTRALATESAKLAAATGRASDLERERVLALARYQTEAESRAACERALRALEADAREREALFQDLQELHASLLDHVRSGRTVTADAADWQAEADELRQRFDALSRTLDSLSRTSTQPGTGGTGGTGAGGGLAGSNASSTEDYVRMQLRTAEMQQAVLELKAQFEERVIELESRVSEAADKLRRLKMRQRTRRAHYAQLEAGADIGPYSSGEDDGDGSGSEAAGLDAASVAARRREFAATVRQLERTLLADEQRAAAGLGETPLDSTSPAAVGSSPSAEALVRLRQENAELHTRIAALLESSRRTRHALKERLAQVSAENESMRTDASPARSPARSALNQSGGGGGGGGGGDSDDVIAELREENAALHGQVRGVYDALHMRQSFLEMQVASLDEENAKLRAVLQASGVPVDASLYAETLRRENENLHARLLALQKAVDMQNLILSIEAEDEAQEGEVLRARRAELVLSTERQQSVMESQIQALHETNQALRKRLRAATAGSGEYVSVIEAELESLRAERAELRRSLVASESAHAAYASEIEAVSRMHPEYEALRAKLDSLRAANAALDARLGSLSARQAAARTPSPRAGASAVADDSPYAFCYGGDDSAGQGAAGDAGGASALVTRVDALTEENTRLRRMLLQQTPAARGGEAGASGRLGGSDSATGDVAAVELCARLSALAAERRLVQSRLRTSLARLGDSGAVGNNGGLASGTSTSSTSTSAAAAAAALGEAGEAERVLGRLARDEDDLYEPVQAALRSAGQTRAVLREDLRGAAAHNDELQAALAREQAESARLAALAAQQAAQLAAQATERERLLNTLRGAPAHAALVAASDELGGLRARNDALFLERQAAETRAAELEAAVAASNSSGARVQALHADALADLRLQLDGVMADRSRIVEERDALATRADKLAAALARAKAEADQAGASRDGREASEMQLQTERHARARAEDELARLQNQIVHRLEATENAVRAAAQQRAAVRTQLASLPSDPTALRRAVEDLLTEREALRAQLAANEALLENSRGFVNGEAASIHGQVEQWHREQAALMQAIAAEDAAAERDWALHVPHSPERAHALERRIAKLAEHQRALVSQLGLSEDLLKRTLYTFDESAHLISALKSRNRKLKADRESLRRGQ